MGGRSNPIFKHFIFNKKYHFPVILGAWTLYVDPTMSIVMVSIILKTSIPLLMETSKILMNSAPSHIQINDLKDRLLSTMPEIKNVHELHVWQLAGDKIIG